MQLLPILLIAAVMAVAGGLRPLGAGWGIPNWTVAVMACGPVVAVLLVIAAGMKWTQSQMNLGRVPAPIIFAERLARGGRVFMLVNHLIAVLVFGWLGAIRSVIGDPILLDEVIAVLPPLLGMTGIWWLYYPIERRLHDAMLIRQLDIGGPIHPTLSRAGYVLLQVRLHLLFLLVPILIIAALSELMNVAADAYGISKSSEWMLGVGKIAAGAGVFMLAPLFARIVLDVRPMALGPMRESLLAVCNRHRVRIRELLIWHTNGTMFNAAVMGLVGRLRYVLITDALLETLREDQVHAVMAHEIGHVRRHHLPWMVVCLMACFMLVGFILEFPVHMLEERGFFRSQTMVDGVSIGLGVAELAAGLAMFGWVCRRFERQADTFAVQHLSGLAHAETSPGSPSGAEVAAAPPSAPAWPEFAGAKPRVTPVAAQTMCAALEAIARLNTIDINRPSWRHGSIGWRMEYLLSIVGLPIEQLPIDRLVRFIKLGAALILIFFCGYAVLEYLRHGGALP